MVTPVQQLHAQVVLWLHEAFGDAAPWALAEPMAVQAERMGWLDMLARLLTSRPQPPGQGATQAAEVARMALDTIDQRIDFVQARARTAALALADFDRALLCLHAYQDEALTSQGGHIGVIRLMAEDTSDNELAARAFWTLGRATSQDADWAVHAFEAGLVRLQDDPPTALKAGLALDYARCQKALGQTDVAAKAAGKAVAWAALAGDRATETTATLFQAVTWLEDGEPQRAMSALAPLADRRAPAGATLPPDDEVAVVLEACVDRQIDTLFQALSATAAPDAEARFESALASPGTAAFRYRAESERRLLFARWLAAQGDARASLTQAGRAVQALDRAALPPAFLDDMLALGTPLLTAGWVTDVGSLLAALLARRAPDWPPDATWRLELLHATALQKAGATREAEAHLLQLLERCRAEGRRAEAAVVAYVLGENALLDRRLSQGIDWYEQARAAAAERGDDVLAGAALNKIATAWMQRHEPARGLPAHEQALALHRRAQAWNHVVVDLIQAVQSHLQVGDLARAAALAEELAQRGSQHPPEDPEWVPFVLARVAAAQGAWPLARTRFQQALAIVEQRRRLLPTPEARRTWSLQKADTYGLAIEAAIAAGAGEDAVEFLELGRHRYLRSLAEPAPGPQEPDWPALAAALPGGFTALWFGAFPGGFGVVAARRHDDGSVHVATRHDPQLGPTDLKSLFEGDLPQIGDAARQGRVVEWLHQAITETRTMTLGVGADRQRHGAPWEAGLARACEVIGQRVWPLLSDAASAVGTPDAAELLLLPSVGCSELPVAAARPATPAGQSPPGQCVMPSLSAWAGERRHAALPAAIDLGMTQVVNPGEDAHLLCCTAEAALSARAFGRPVQRLLGRRARRQRVLDALAHSDVVHFIGHAFVDWNDPHDSGLVCAPQGDDDGVLTLREILARVGQVRSRVVILSACQVGNVQSDRQNEFLNLPGALVTAGAELVLAPRWQVEDVPTALLLTRTLAGWFAGTPLPRALAEASRWLRDAVTTDVVVEWLDVAADDPASDRDGLQRLAQDHRMRYAPADLPYAHPRHWGAFELTGHPA